MSLDGLFRVRVEPDLRARFERLARQMHTTPSALARKIMWERVESEEMRMREEPVHYGRRRTPRRA